MKFSEVELGFYATPDEAGPVPGVVVIHDVWGLSGHTRSIAGRLADHGFAALAIDLYRRDPDIEINDPGPWMRSLSDPQVLDDLRGHRSSRMGGGVEGARGLGSMPVPRLHQRLRDHELRVAATLPEVQEAFDCETASDDAAPQDDEHHGARPHRVDPVEVLEHRVPLLSGASCAAAGSPATRFSASPSGSRAARRARLRP